MTNTTTEESVIQREYYERTAQNYDRMHVQPRDKHTFGALWMLGTMEFLDIGSVLDVGSGTGRIVSMVKHRRPSMRVIGLEPVGALRDIGYSHGLDQDALVAGDATHLPYANGEFDMVCEFGALHHMRWPQAAVLEMLRVAKTAIFISDSNNFGQGSASVRVAKQVLNALGLWKVVNLVKTRGLGYTISEGDGLSYSYSVFNDYDLIRRHCQSVHVLNSDGGGRNPYRSAGHVALLGVKAPWGMI